MQHPERPHQPTDQLNPLFDAHAFAALAEKQFPAPAAETEISGMQLVNYRVEHIPTLVDPILQQTGLACLAGSSDTGKSSLLRQLAVSIVSGADDFLGFPINGRHQSVVFVSTEDEEKAVSYLLRRQTQGIAPEKLQKLRFIFNFKTLYDTLDKSLQRQPADLVIIDCFADCFIGDLKDTQKLRGYLNEYQLLSAQHNCLFLFLHHTGKRTEDMEPSKNNLLSGQGFEGKMRLVIELRADPMDPTLRHLCIVKGNYLGQEMKRDSYVLHFSEQDFLFTNTNERMPFEKLAKKTESEADDRAKYLEAVQLKNEGKTHDEIAKLLKYKNKCSITELLKRGPSKGWDM
jgi:hypothetical protein